MPSDQYTVIVSGQRFVFTRDQLESEPGNYFATCFFGGFQEATNDAREISLQKDTLIFKLIQAHLRGYKVLPLDLPDTSLLDYTTRQRVLENLLLDTQYFSMSRLESLVREELGAIKEREDKQHGGQRKYQLWWHKYSTREAVELAVIEGFTKTIVPLSSEGLKLLFEDHDRVISTCVQCAQISSGWELVALVREKGTQPRSQRTHFVVESRLE